MVSNAFSFGLTKTAGVISAVGGAALKALGTVGKTVVKAGGGKLNTALTAMDANNQFKQNMNRVQSLQTPRGL